MSGTDDQDQQANDVPTAVAEGNNIWERLSSLGLVPAGTDFSDYVAEDSNLVVRETITEEGILQTLEQQASTPSGDTNAAEEDDDDESNVQPPPSFKEAMGLIHQLKNFVQSTESDSSVYSKLVSVESSICDTFLASKRKQTSIRDFFK